LAFGQKPDSPMTFRIPTLLAFICSIVPLLSDDGADSAFEITRRDKFDDSSEKVIKQFADLKAAMTVDQVREAFPSHVVWESRRTDGNLEVGLGFPWQEEVFIEFYFRNTHPDRANREVMPSLASEHWGLVAAVAVRLKREIQDGHHVVTERFDSPFVRYVFKPSTTRPNKSE